MAILKTVSKIFDWDTMKPLYIRGVASTYTKDELAKLNNFFVQPDAKIFLSKQQVLVNNMMNIGNELSRTFLLPELEKLKIEMVKGIKHLEVEAIAK